MPNETNLPGPSSAATDPRKLLVVVCVAFFAVGMAQAAFGPALPDLARRAGSGLVAAGGALTAQFTGSLLGYATAGILLRRMGRMRVLVAGMALFVLAAAGVAASSTLGMLLAAAATMGFVTAIAVLAGNILAAESSRSAGPLNLVNAAYGMGAIASPALIAASLTRWGTGLPALWGTPVAMAVGVGIAYFWASASADRPPLPEPPAARGRSSRLLSSPLLWTFCAFMFASVSTEVSLGGWLPTLLDRAAAIGPAEGAAALSWLWALMTVMRLVASWTSRRIGPWATLSACIGLAVAGGALLLACAALQSPALGLAAATFFGLGLGPIMPTAFGMLTASYPRDTGMATGLMMAVGAIGAATVPWTMGALIVGVGPLAGAAIPLAMALMMALLLAAIASLRRSTIDDRSDRYGGAHGRKQGAMTQRSRRLRRRVALTAEGRAKGA